MSANEEIILSAHDIVINTIPAEAILTNQRLMLVDRSHPRLLPQDIPFSAIETVTIGENSGDNPVLSLSIVTPDGTRQPLGIIFPHGTRGDRLNERDEWATRARELSMNAQQETGIVAAELIPPWVPGAIPEEAGIREGEEVVPAGTRFKGPSLSERRSKAAEASTRRTLGIVAAGIFVIAAIAVVIFFLAPAFTGTPSDVSPTPSLTPVPTGTDVPVTMPTPNPTVIPTTEVTTAVPTQTPDIVPQTGVWLRVNYNGNFKGSAGAPGRFRDITGSGEQFYQIPAKNEYVSAAITKLDNSGNPLTVEFYNEGVLVKTATITKPSGTLELAANLKTAVPANP